ncbi:MBL fold metallo-hydrolase [Pseudomonadales bacterium]|nr:MBL fold metallo-hydrolase [Pseudomonadales bacterium]MDC1368768.1 MBL fold metallo-hydrolase [Pseudomonadales bacterium]
MRLFFLNGLLLMVMATASTRAESESSPLFANANRDGDGRFTNPTGDLSHGSLGVRAAFLLRRFGTYFRSGKDAPDRRPNDGAFLRENARHSVPTVTWVGHATLLVQMAHLSFLTDPTWSNRPSPVPLIGPSRYVAPGLLMDDLPPIDFVVISHNHYDHLDLPTLGALATRNAGTIFYVPLGNAALLRDAGITNVVELDWGQTASYAGVTIHCLPAQHWSKRSLTDTHKALWSSWAVTGPERKFYFAGDTGYFAGFAEIGRKLGPFDLAALPIGAYAPRAMMRESHMNPEEALLAADDLQASQAVGIHFGTFDLSDEPLDEPPRRFKAGTVDAEIDDADAWVLDIGETRRF